MRYEKRKFEKVLGKVCGCRSANHVEFVTELGIYAVMMYRMDESDAKMLHATKRPGRKGTGQ
jgi:hypothetical protein